MGVQDQGRYAVARLRAMAKESLDRPAGDEHRSAGDHAERAKGDVKHAGDKAADAFRR